MVPTERHLIIDSLFQATMGLSLPEPTDLRGRLPVSQGKQWKRRDVSALKGMTWHQELGWGSVEQVAKYHTGPQSHLADGGTETIAYTWAIRRNGQICLCVDPNKSTWSQGYRGRPGDENAEFMSVMFEGLFRYGPDSPVDAGEPSAAQLLAAMILWDVCRTQWDWPKNALYGHFDFGKPACPGTTLQTVVTAVRDAVAAKPEGESDPTTSEGRLLALQALGYADRGPRNRQKMLHTVGYNISVDGDWGPNSRGVLVQFQTDNGLGADGVWGTLTEKKIITVLSK